ncbi:hypothetical protein SRHO_G00170130 [Serrasalmus rhombeus]
MNSFVPQFFQYILRPDLLRNSLYNPDATGFCGISTVSFLCFKAITTSYCVIAELNSLYTLTHNQKARQLPASTAPQPCLTKREKPSLERLLSFDLQTLWRLLRSRTEPDLRPA